MESFNREQKKREIVHTKKGEQIKTNEFTEYGSDDPFYYSVLQLYYPNKQQEATLTIEYNE